MTTFRTVYPNAGHPMGVYSGDRQSWDAADFLKGIVAQLAKNPSDEASRALERLKNAEQDSYTDLIKTLQYEQNKYELRVYIRLQQLNKLKQFQKIYPTVYI